MQHHVLIFLLTLYLYTFFNITIRNLFSGYNIVQTVVWFLFVILGIFQSGVIPNQHGTLSSAWPLEKPQPLRRWCGCKTALLLHTGRTVHFRAEAWRAVRKVSVVAALIWSVAVSRAARQTAGDVWYADGTGAASLPPTTQIRSLSAFVEDGDSGQRGFKGVPSPGKRSDKIQEVDIQIKERWAFVACSTI